MQHAKHALVFEPNIYVSLLRWLLRRPSIPEGSEPVGYAQLATPMTALWIFGSALELPLVHVLVPWHGLRLALLLIGIWGTAVDARRPTRHPSQRCRVRSRELHLTLRHQLRIHTKKGEMLVSALSLWEDEPHEVAPRLRRCAESRASRN